ncbi:MAG: OsmC family protein [Synechococcales cyanobacterium C42_A2020_086]|jgi:organic hydroperoxide reductase OsmC/OhrA|nr:OsmC family protein [Synechococcales cyanobacterium M58_A2018_015]MBF2072605.1 OsmC family protein [Synechococcales cyanobacterium C42_A2020_086]
MIGEHTYRATTIWTGASKGATTSYEAYSREYIVAIDGKLCLVGSADPTFRGNPALHNPEDLLVSSLSACHMLSYLALCARAGVRVVSYVDEVKGTMSTQDGKVRFTEVTLKPRVLIEAGDDIEKARSLHHDAHEICFIANSVAFPVRHESSVLHASEAEEAWERFEELAS